MMIVSKYHHRSNPAAEILPCDCRHVDDPTAFINSPLGYSLAALQRSLQDNVVSAEDEDPRKFDSPADKFSGDDFRMFEFKVKKCGIVRSHDWTACPYAHPEEKARRRDPRKYHYSGDVCSDFRKGGACRRGDACEYAHGVFESWLHPARYRTQPCKDGTQCRRRVCFFAHTAKQLRVLPYADCPDAPPSRVGHESSFVSTALLEFSPKSTLYYPPALSPATVSPPVSPSGSVSLNTVNQLSESVRLLQLNKMGLASPPLLRVGSLRIQGPVRRSFLDGSGWSGGEETSMERVESGRELRERLYSKLGRENSLDRVGRVNW